MGLKDRVYILDRFILSVEWLKMKYLVYINVINIDYYLINNLIIYKDECCCDDIYFYWDDKLSVVYLILEWFKFLIEKGENYKKMYEKLEFFVEVILCWDIFIWKNLGNSLKEFLLKKRVLLINLVEKILGVGVFYNFIIKKLNFKNYIEEVFDYFMFLDEVYNMKIDNLYDFVKRVISDFDYKGYKLGIIYGIDGDY